MNIYQLFKVPNQPRMPTPPSPYCRIGCGIVDLIIRAGESGGVPTQTEFRLTKFCAEHKLKKRTADGLLCMLRRDDFVREEIRAETIRELENIVTANGGSKIHEYDFWTKDDGKQEVELYLRSLKQIIEGILVDL